MSEKPPRRPAQYADLEDVPAHLVGEIIGGELYVSSRPRAMSTRAAGQLFSALEPLDGTPGPGHLGGWVLLFEPELRLGGEALVPDIAGWRRERMPELPDTPALTLVPDWVCEVLSPFTEAGDRARKMSAYARQGVRHLWSVDPPPQMLEVYRCEAGRWSQLGVHVGEVSVRAEPFAPFCLSLERLWRR